jgi:predicted nuclease of restriction endonuclease-like (RecB) superfamily
MSLDLFLKDPLVLDFLGLEDKYLTALPPKKLFEKKLNDAILKARFIAENKVLSRKLCLRSF